jgi:hypothetical protein
MPLSFFCDKSTPPSDEALRSALADAAGLWRELIEQLGADISPVDSVWGFTSKSTGWSLRVKRADRDILYMTPSDGYWCRSASAGERPQRPGKAS